MILDCVECECDDSGSIGQSCDFVTGKCKCKSNYIGDKCSECAVDLYNYPICERKLKTFKEYLFLSLFEFKAYNY